MSTAGKILKFTEKAKKLITKEEKLLIKIEKEIKDNLQEIATALRRHDQDGYYTAENSKTLLISIVNKINNGMDIWKNLKRLEDGEGELVKIGTIAHKGYNGLREYKSQLLGKRYKSQKEAINGFKDIMLSTFNDLDKEIKNEIKIDEYFKKAA